MIYGKRFWRIFKTIVVLIILSPLIYWSWLQVLLLLPGEEEKAEFEPMSFDTNRSLRYAEEISDFGPRPPGSPNATSTAGYIMQELTDRGLSCRIENTSVPAFTLRNEPVYMAHVKTTENGEFTVAYDHLSDYLALLYTGNTFGDQTRRAVFAGNGNPANYSSIDSVRGKVVVVEFDGSMDYSWLYMEAVNRSAFAQIIIAPDDRRECQAAVIVENGEAMTVQEYYQNTKNLIPAVVMTRTRGNELVSLLRNATDSEEFVDFQVNVDAFLANAKTRTVVADTSPDKRTAVIAVVSYDSFYNSPGAQRGIACPAAMMEIAGSVVEDRPKKNVRFLFLCGSAPGPFALQSYARNHRKELNESDPTVIYLRGIDLQPGGGSASIHFPNGKDHSTAVKVKEAWEKHWKKKNPSHLNRKPVIVNDLPGEQDSLTSFVSIGLSVGLVDTESAPVENTPGDGPDTLDASTWKAPGSYLASLFHYFASL